MGHDALNQHCYSDPRKCEIFGLAQILHDLLFCTGMLISLRTLSIFLFLVQLSHAFGSKKNSSSSSLNTGQMQGALYVDALSIPSPGEFFAAINKVSRPNWTTLDHGGNAPVTTNRAQLALAIGVFVTNGFIAVEAQDGQQVKNIGRDMMTLSKALGVSRTILSRGNNLIDFADDGQWDSLRNELEATENEVKSTMLDQQDHYLITLISAGAWLRELEVASEIIANHYSQRGAALLQEPDLAFHLAYSLEFLPNKLRADPLVINVKETLNHLATLLKKERHGLTKEDLSLIQLETKKIIAAISASDSSPLSLKPVSFPAP
ncbi:MAG: hypothetical protein K9M81_02410 [Chthoniobacterales bacterium]|nr:hypothetical protein [Chthoniobacterales bacterium]